MITHTNVKDRALSLMETNLRGGQPLAAEYPLVFEQEAPGWVVVTEESGQDVSACSGVVRNLVVPGAHGPLKVGFVGSVVTQEQHRGQGFARATLEAACDRVAQEGGAFAFLWADDAAVYESMGWFPAGTEFDFKIDDNQRSFLPDAVGVREAGPEDAEAILSLYDQHPQRVVRSLEEQRHLLRIPGLTCWVKETEGQVCAYACVGRGADLQGVVHEWGGRGEEFLAVLSGILDARDDEGLEDDLFLMVPSSATAILDYLQITGCPGVRGILGLAKVASLENAARVLSERVPEDVQVGVQGASVVLMRGSRSISLDERDLLRLMLPSAGDERILSKVERRLRCSLEQVDLQPFVWGLDSI